MAILPALVASLSLFESLGGVPVIAARLRELSGHLRAELVEAGKPHDCRWGSDLNVFYGPSNDRANRIHAHRSLWGRDGSG